jgi:PAS domain S-box-containing protein
MRTATLLIVDDTSANIFALENLLEKEGRVILKANNGNEALKIAFNHPIDLIILDVQMAGMDGFEVAQLLKSNKKTQEIPIIFASAVNREHVSMLKGYEEGAVDYLLKPLDPEITRAKVSILLQNQLQKKELTEKNLSLEKSALLIHNSADILGIFNLSTLTFEEVNHAITTTLGFSVEEIKKLSIPSLLNEEGQRRFSEIVLQNQERISFELEFKSKDGTEKYLQWYVTVKEKKWFVNARDITLQKLADDRIMILNASLQENLQKLGTTNKELESFSYSISHDLRAPLRSIVGYSRILQEEYGQSLGTEAKRILETVQRNGHKMADLIDSLLEFSKLGRQELRKAEVNMTELVGNILEELKASFPQKLTLIQNTLIAAKADRSLLSQVWLNLLSNAVKYSSKKENAQVEIGSNQIGNEVVYYVKDNGAGFDMKYSNKLFDVFQRLHSSDQFEGTGIGLAIVQRIVVRHGGRVWAEAEPDRGAVFYFSLPL